MNAECSASDAGACVRWLPRLTWIDVGGVGDVAHAQLHRGTLLLRKAAVVRALCTDPAMSIGLRKARLARSESIEALAACLHGMPSNVSPASKQAWIMHLCRVTIIEHVLTRTW